MRQVVIENPILNSPFHEPTRHWEFTDEGITDRVVESRRLSAYFVPIPQPRKRGKDRQMVFDTEWTRNRLKENEFINKVRARVRLWREGGYLNVTKTTRRLLEYWTNPQREKKLFFCQIEAVETAIYITEGANKFADDWIINDIRDANESANPGLFRLAFKMATGSGKTVVMAMLIAWQALNKFANPQDSRFCDSFLIVTPGITIRDRLRVLWPSESDNYYRQRELLPAPLLDELGRAKIVITNFHAFLRREKVAAAKLTKAILAGEDKERFLETPDEMARRVCRDLGNKKAVVVINDEAHHCYRHKPDVDVGRLSPEERDEAKKEEAKARIWISGLEAVKAKLGLKVIYDLSATPFFLRGSGYREGDLFPWVVSDFALIDAIESGIVKIPRVPVGDDTMTAEQPTYRDLWPHICKHLPKKGRGTEAVEGQPNLPAELEGALLSLYGNYEKQYRAWETKLENEANGTTPPVFIVVCNNTNVSKVVCDYVAGWEKELSDGARIVVPGKLAVFSNEKDGGWTSRPNTILIDSEQLESGEAMSKEFKQIATREIEEFKSEYRARFPGRDPENITDEELLREVMNTIGKKGKLGENVKCVVSVSMLTEGWDATTVTHILGVRAFSTQLLCEQVVGRGLRRRSYAPNVENRFDPDYAEVYGVPFSFIPCSGSTVEPKPGPPAVRVRAMEDRAGCEITFPRVQGYRYELPSEKLSAAFSDDSRMTLSTETVPFKTENAPIVGETSIHTLEDLKLRRMQEVGFLLAKLVLEKYFRWDGTERKGRPKEHTFDSDVQAWLFPQVLDVTGRWLAQCVTCKDNTFPQMLLLIENAHDAADRIYGAIVHSQEGQKTLMPILEPYNTIGSTKDVDFDTTRPVYVTNPAYCHISHVVGDTASWEQKMAQALEDLGDEGVLFAYVKNQQLGFCIPYAVSGEEHNYMPDFIVRLDDSHGRDDPLHLIIEVTGERDREKAAKVAAARNLWIPAVNNHGSFGRWDFVEIADPWDAKNTIRARLQKAKEQGTKS